MKLTVRTDHFPKHNLWLPQLIQLNARCCDTDATISF